MMYSSHCGVVPYLLVNLLQFQVLLALFISRTSPCRNRNRNISLTKGWAKDIISPLGCNSPVKEGCMHVGPIVAPISTMACIK